jgi:hypothetical protein
MFLSKNCLVPKSSMCVFKIASASFLLVIVEKTTALSAFKTLLCLA